MSKPSNKSRIPTPSLSFYPLFFSLLAILFLSNNQAQAEECVGNFCKDHKAYFSYYKREVGTIWEVGRIIGFTSSRAIITAPFLDKDLEVNLNELGLIKRDACHGDFCIGNSVYFYHSEDREMKKGSIVGVIGNGNLVISGGFLSSKRALSPRDLYLAYRGRCSNDLICVGDSIRGNYNTSGEVFGIGLSGYLIGSSEPNYSGDSNSTKFKFHQINFNNATLTTRSIDNEKRVVKIQEERRIAAEKAAIEKSETDEVSQLVREKILNLDIYKNSRQAGNDHKKSVLLASGPTWYRMDQTHAFFAKLSEFVYAFDAQYMAELSKIIPQEVERDPSAKFVLAAILPYLKSFGYQSMKGRYIDSSVDRIESMLAGSNYKSIKDIESSMLTRRLCLQILAASIRSARPVMNEAQKEKATPIINALGETLAGTMRVREMEKFFTILPEMEELIRDLAQNPYLQGRSATDMLVLEYLKNS